MGDENKSIDARLDVLERRILAQGATAEEWAVEVAKPVEGVWTTTFYVGVQSFRLAEDNSNERKIFSGGRGASQSSPDGAEQHCMFIGRMFVKALQALVNAETRTLRQAIVTANDQLFDSRLDGVKDGHTAAFETLQTVIREWLEPEPAVGLAGAGGNQR